MFAQGPSLTVAIPTYQGERHLKEALQSILGQEGVSFDLLICDDRSEDQTLSLAREVAGDRARILVNTERLGLAGNWNQCVQQCSTDLIAIFHQDDRMEVDHLRSHVQAFESAPQAGFVCSEASVIDETGRAISDQIIERGGVSAVDRFFAPREFLPWLAVRNPLRCSSITLNREAHRAVGGFDASYRYVVDWDFWIRVSRSWPVVWKAHPTIAMRWHTGSETHRFRRGDEDLTEIQQLQETIFSSMSDHPDLPSWKKAARRRLARAYLNRTHDSLKGADTARARAYLRKAFELDRGVVRTVAADPRLAIALAGLSLAPRWVEAWYRSRAVGNGPNSHPRTS